MDHRWGRNIQIYGLGSFGITLCSRILGAIGTKVLINRLTAGGDAIIVHVPADTRPDDPYTYEVVARYTEHFPYGFNVEPDAPV